MRNESSFFERGWKVARVAVAVAAIAVVLAVVGLITQVLVWTYVSMFFTTVALTALFTTRYVLALGRQSGGDPDA